MSFEADILSSAGVLALLTHLRLSISALRTMVAPTIEGRFQTDIVYMSSTEGLMVQE
jgi:hypothetical protein